MKENKRPKLKTDSQNKKIHVEREKKYLLRRGFRLSIRNKFDEFNARPDIENINLDQESMETDKKTKCYYH